MFLRAGIRTKPLVVLRKALSADAAHNLRRPAPCRQFASQVDGAEETTGASFSSRGDARKSPTPLERKVRLHLQWLSNPYKFQELVQSQLAKDEYNEAELLVQRGSIDHKLTVSWNHLIRYLMRKGKLHSAIDVFNDMKKRAQIPDAQTYNIIFNGCATNSHAKTAVGMATRIYQSMLNGTNITPNTIHMNTVLKVCSRAKDLDSLFLIAATANETTRIPDTWTYTIILNALRNCAFEEERVQRRDGHPTNSILVVDEKQAQVAVARGNAVWEEVLTRWRRGLITMDDSLVCAMGRLLTLVETPNHSHVLALVEQTLNIPRLDRHVSGQTEDDGESRPAAPHTTQTEEPKTPQPPPAVSAGRLPKPGMFAQPGKQSLGLVMMSLEKTRKASLGVRYWDVFTARGVEPDAVNWFQLLRVLRSGHSSADTAAMLPQMPRAFLEPRTFRTAMDTCVADHRNASAFAHATAVLDVMKRSLPTPDPKTLRTYLKVVQLSARRLFHACLALDPDPRTARHAMGVQLLRGLDRLWEALRLATNSLTFPEARRRSGREAGRKAEREAAVKRLADREDVYALARGMMGAMDQVVSEGMVGGKILKLVKVRKGLLARQILRLSEQMKKKDMSQSFESGGKDANLSEPNAEREDGRERRSGPRDLFRKELSEEFGEEFDEEFDEEYNEARTRSPEEVRLEPSF